MADPSPADAAEGQEPEAGEGQEPEQQGEASTEGAQEAPEARTYSQSYVKQLRRENAEARTRLAELEAERQQREDADKTEQERLAEAKEAAERRAAEAEAKLLRVEVAGELGLDLSAVQFLTGTTREEIEHRGEELAKLLKQGKPAAGFDGGARPKTPPEKKAPEEEHNDFLLRALGRTPQS